MEAVVTIPRPARHYVLLCAEDGGFLGTADGAGLEVRRHADDRAVWERAGAGGELRHVATGLALRPAAGGGAAWALAAGGAPVRGGAPFAARHGPAELPSRYLERFRRDGWVCLPAVLAPETVDGLQRVSGTGRHAGRRFDRRAPPLCQSAAVARAATDPVSLWLLRQYLGTPSIRLGHTPSIRVIGKDDGKAVVQGWHSDFPYLWGVGDRVPTQEAGLPVTQVLGVQFNVCITDFTRDNGATRFKLGSHALNRGPPREWGIDIDYLTRRGYRAERGEPYAGAECATIEAPAGSVILYDARTWHRSGINRTDGRRGALLTAVTPAYVLPFFDQSKAYKEFAAGPLPAELDARERQEAAEIMVCRISGVAVGEDAELQQLARAGGGGGGKAAAGYGSRM